jgi:hypothetical protein
MADERSKDEPSPEDEVAADGSVSPKKPDLRVSSHQDLGVNVSRDLNAGGWLARGDRSNMSKLRFSVQAKPRDEPDPELQALRDPPAPKRAPVDPAPTAPPTIDAAPPSADAAATPAPPVEKPDGLLGRIGRLFGGE